jgi:hypothetical protein
MTVLRIRANRALGFGWSVRSTITAALVPNDLPAAENFEIGRNTGIGFGRIDWMDSFRMPVAQAQAAL